MIKKKCKNVYSKSPLYSYGYKNVSNNKSNSLRHLGLVFTQFPIYSPVKCIKILQKLYTIDR